MYTDMFSLLVWSIRQIFSVAIALGKDLST